MSIWQVTVSTSKSRFTSTDRSVFQMTAEASRSTCIRSSRCLRLSWFSPIFMREESSIRVPISIPADCTGSARSASMPSLNGLRLRFPGTGSSITWSLNRVRPPRSSASLGNRRRLVQRSPSSQTRSFLPIRPSLSSICWPKECGSSPFLIPVYR